MKQLKPNELKKWMDLHGKNPAYVAGAANVSVRTVNRFLSGESHPTPIIADAIKRIIEQEPEKTA